MEVSALNEEQLREMAIAIVGNAESPAQAYVDHLNLRPYLADCKFVLAAEHGAQPGFAINHTFSGGAAVRSLFQAEKILVLDQHTVQDMEGTGAATYGIDYSISLDTQSVSFLEPYINRRAKVPSDFADVFAFIARDDVNVDPMPYKYENISRMREGNADEIERSFSKLKAYQVLCTLDAVEFHATGQARSRLSDFELTTRTQQLLSQWLLDNADGKLDRSLTFRHSFCYALLLKMAVLQIAGPRRPLEEKLLDFLHFCESDLAVMCMRESMIARRYFQQGARFRFFRKIQKRKQGIFDSLKNMAWDLLHVRHMEELMTILPDERARYFIPALLTFDKGLIEVIDLYPLKAFATVTGSGQARCFYGSDLPQALFDNREQQEGILAWFYSDQAIQSRTSRIPEAKDNLPKTIQELEMELAFVAEVPLQAT